MARTKHIFVTGGVVSSLGKGLTAASIGMILHRGGLRVRLQKLDPYINVDPGTMNPFQHGEVYVTEDGAETDLDLGHYERFTGVPVSRSANYTTGQIYTAVIEKERRGDFLGGTVQVVPHITDEIKLCIRRLAAPDVDVVITEIGGTVGDIEGLPFLEAIRQMRHDEGRGRVLYVHLTLVPYIRAAGEQKTKPTQQSVSRLREIGIQPDILICRTEQPLTEELRGKIALFCNVEDQAVIEEQDVESSIYEIPEVLIRQGFHEVVADCLGLPLRPPEMADWRAMLGRIQRPAGEVRIAVVGKYVRLQDAYKSVYEALAHAGARRPAASRGRASSSIAWRPRTSKRAAVSACARSMAYSCPAASVRAASRARSRRRATRVSRAFPTWVCAWASRSQSSSSPATCWVWQAPTRPSSIPTRRIPSLPCSIARSVSRAWGTMRRAPSLAAWRRARASTPPTVASTR